ncbi:unnamed protein product [Acanthosepion pharaonis]|uniref:Uncharacterized protein n=1 Tax=Acanthosepion pharaonis TaxID=158019 RepID=A0A812BM92_ACAPH|nr:unnamed protein product [Sepia pharaonis]
MLQNVFRYASDSKLRSPEGGGIQEVKLLYSFLFPLVCVSPSCPFFSFRLPHYFLATRCLFSPSVYTPRFSLSSHPFSSLTSFINSHLTLHFFCLFSTSGAFSVSSRHLEPFLSLLDIWRIFSLFPIHFLFLSLPLSLSLSCLLPYLSSIFSFSLTTLHFRLSLSYNLFYFPLLNFYSLSLSPIKKNHFQSSAEFTLTPLHNLSLSLCPPLLVHSFLPLCHLLSPPLLFLSLKTSSLALVFFSSLSPISFFCLFSTSRAFFFYLFLISGAFLPLLDIWSFFCLFSSSRAFSASFRHLELFLPLLEIWSFSASSRHLELFLPLLDIWSFFCLFPTSILFLSHSLLALFLFFSLFPANLLSPLSFSLDSSSFSLFFSIYLLFHSLLPSSFFSPFFLRIFFSSLPLSSSTFSFFPTHLLFHFLLPSYFSLSLLLSFFFFFSLSSLPIFFPYLPLTSSFFSLSFPYPLLLSLTLTLSLSLLLSSLFFSHSALSLSPCAVNIIYPHLLIFHTFFSLSPIIQILLPVPHLPRFLPSFQAFYSLATFPSYHPPVNRLSFSDVLIFRSILRKNRSAIESQYAVLQDNNWPSNEL